MKNRPNLFIVGAPKSGTTAIYHYLNGHPDIFMSEVKEPYYFGNDIHYRMKRMSEEEYMLLFSKAPEEKYRGEASVTYLYSESAPYEIKAFNPDSKIIIILRDPVEMMYSLHSQLCFTAFEDEGDFKKALSLEGSRKLMKNIPDNCKIVDFLFYREFAKYYAQVKRYLEVFGSENVHVGIFDDFERDPDMFYREVLSFLGVNADPVPYAFARINANKRIRRRWIFDMLSSGPVVAAARLLIPSRRLRQSISLVISNWNISKEPRKPLEYSLENDLRNEFKDEIEKLSLLLSRDMKLWGQER
ncbi:MAG: sulfotransferase domain-containing protein [Nitrospirota bacterium]|nr:MAG: sulfotransferase domain-containing protein [Nitrospirota bacterium]